MTPEQKDRVLVLLRDVAEGARRPDMNQRDPDDLQEWLDAFATDIEEAIAIVEREAVW